MKNNSDTLFLEQEPTPIQPVVVDNESIHYNTYLMKKDEYYFITYKESKYALRVHNNLVEFYEYKSNWEKRHI